MTVKPSNLENQSRVLTDLFQVPQSPPKSRKFSQTTLSGHRFWNTRLLGATSIAEILDIFEKTLPEFSWGASSKRTKFGQLIGAVQRNPSLGMENFAKHPLVKDRLHQLDADMWQSYVRPLPAAHKDQVQAAIVHAKSKGSLKVASFIALWWALSGRPSDVLNIKPSLSDLESDELAVTFMTGKGVLARRQPYTVFTSVGPWHKMVASQLRKAKILQDQTSQDVWFTKEIFEQARELLRQFIPNFDSRMFRRGAARTLAKAGANLSDIRAFTGHTNDAQTLRYLGWGRFYTKQQLRSVKLARKMW